MTSRDLERLLGRRVQAAWRFALIGPGPAFRLFRRVEGEGWAEHPPYLEKGEKAWTKNR